jgi:cysteine desulfurase
MPGKSIYMDYAAATPVDEAVVKAMKPYFTGNFYNPSASYLAAKSVSKDINKTRSDIAQILGAKAPEIVFTAGGTEANNLAIKGVMDKWPGSNVVISAIEHESVIEPAKLYDHKIAPVDKEGIVNLNELTRLIDEKTVLVSIIYANNEIGTIQPLKDIGVMLEAIRKQRRLDGNNLPIYFHSDACQAASFLDLHVERLGVNLMTLNSGKIYGPKQSGALYIKRGLELQAQILGGGQESDIRSGTENVAAIIGFGLALSLVQNRRREESDRLQILQNSFIKTLQEKVPQALINGSLKKRLPNNVHITIEGTDNEQIMMALDEMGIQCATGSACHAASGKSSSTLDALGLSRSQAKSSLRFSMGRFTTTDDVLLVCEKLADVLA